MQLIVKVQSASDIITNSSSEIFSVKTNLSKEAITSILKEVHNQYRYTGTLEDWNKLSKEERIKYEYESGLAGILEIETFNDGYKNMLQNIPDNKKHLFTKKIYSIFFKKSLKELEEELTIEIDENFTHTIDWILTNLYVVDSCHHPSIKNKEGRVIKLLPWDEEDYVVDDNGNKK
jgi:hypothetical protein